MLRKLRLGEVARFSQDPTARGRSWDLNAEPVLLLLPWIFLSEVVP